MASQITGSSTVFPKLVEIDNMENIKKLHIIDFFKENPSVIGGFPHKTSSDGK